MEIIFFLLPLCVLIALGFIGGFLWMTRNGQYDDLETPANRILLDDKVISTNNNNPSLRPNKERK